MKSIFRNPGFHEVQAPEAWVSLKSILRQSASWKFFSKFTFSGVPTFDRAGNMQGKPLPWLDALYRIGAKPFHTVDGQKSMYTWPEGTIRCLHAFEVSRLVWEGELVLLFTAPRAIIVSLVLKVSGLRKLCSWTRTERSRPREQSGSRHTMFPSGIGSWGRVALRTERCTVSLGRSG